MLVLFLQGKIAGNVAGILLDVADTQNKKGLGLNIPGKFESIFRKKICSSIN